ncbi:MAG: hypothetical protein QW678_03100 [Candidatus Aenigmatarchaeota archaeon]
MHLLKFALTKALNTFFPIIFMSKRSNANKAAIKVLAIFLAIFGLAALSIAGLLEYYASAVATIEVKQGVVIVDSNNQEYGYQNPYQVSLTATAGDKTEVTSFTIKYKGNQGSADVNVEIALDSSENNGFTGLFTEIKEYHVTIGGTTCTITSPGSSSCNSYSISADEDSKKITISGITLNPNNNQVNFKLEVVWNPATKPDAYTLTVTVLPA